MVWNNIPRQGKIASALLIVFGIALTPPVVYWVNTEALLFGWPVMFLWAVGWATFAVVVLAWAAKTNAFALSEDQVPPELAEREEVVAPTGPAGEAEPEGGDG